MSELSSDEKTLSLIASGMSRYQRKRKAENQPRDASGRWVGAGANVRWRSNGQDWAGTVEAIKNGKAIVKVRHSDGTETTTTLNPDTLSVMASKARLSSVNKKYFDKGSDIKKYVAKNRDDIEKAAENGGARIERADGYSIDATKKPIDGDGDGLVNEAENSRESGQKDEREEKRKKESNPIIYQLYSPDGRSLGIFNGPSAEGTMNDAISNDSSSSPAPSGASLVSSGSPMSYSVPKIMQEKISDTLADNSDLLSDSDIEFFSKFCSSGQVSQDDISTMKRFIETVELLMNLYGGSEGSKWVEKVDKPTEDYEPIQHDFESGIYEYFVAQHESGIAELLAVDLYEDKVLSWTGVDFSMDHGPVGNYDALFIDPVDEITARQIAYTLHEQMSNAEDASFSAKDIFPEERNLFELAASEMDSRYFSEIAQLAYTPAERSIDAQHQARGEAGKFGKTYSEGMTPGASVKYFAIVDPIDQTAVMDIVAIFTDESGKPVAHRRSMGQWSADSDILAQLTGPTPPPVIHLDSDEQVIDVLSQIDGYDSENESEIVEDSQTESEFSLKAELKSLMNQETISGEEIYDIVKKARSFNRMDLIPEAYRIYGSYSSSEGLYGECGEVITASAASLGHTPLERLENYWLRGPGARKIDWNSSDSVDYAAKTFSKYLGHEQAYAFATILKNRAN